MELKIFSFIEESINLLEEKRIELKGISKEIEEYFEEVLLCVNDGELNVVTRVKSKSSLEDKIIRNNYYKKYNSSKEVILNLQDLIGARIECRFIDDEEKVYNELLSFFDRKHNDGTSYNEINSKIRLNLKSEQPQKQKNGFKIYRIDGIYDDGIIKYNFELQIKSLVNMFWGEIEHKVIYKNKNYMVVDDFFKNILTSIKKNLSMIDNQLSLICDYSVKSDTIDPMIRKKQVETMLSKIVYDLFSNKMKEDIGFSVDFKKSCDAIVNYLFRSNNAKELEDYNETLIKMLSRVNEISKNDIKFNQEIIFDREVKYDNKFSQKAGTKLLEIINIDFDWNLFFRILFEIEPGSNAEDFESFTSYVQNRFYKNDKFNILKDKFSNEELKYIKLDLLDTVCEMFCEKSSIAFIYDKNINKINNIIGEIILLINERINIIDEWEISKNAYKQMLYIKISTEIKLY